MSALVTATGTYQTVGPGLAGFLATFGLAVATVLLFRSMTRHLRKVRYGPGPEGGPGATGEPGEPGGTGGTGEPAEPGEPAGTAAPEDGARPDVPSDDPGAGRRGQG